MIKLGYCFQFFFTDDDNNKIAVSSDAELGLGWREMKMNGKLIYISLFHSGLGVGRSGAGI